MERKNKRRAHVETNDDARKKQKLNDNLRPGEIGIIESVSLCNFMCHDNLDFKLGPQINFIIGQNGSGKSAILTAIILALGGRSSVTGRFPNIKGFIKTGKQKAKIEIVLKNGGDNPYKPDLYGSTVTVVREINSDGVSSYKLKSESGKIISTLKEELNNILNVMDIQIENPVSALTQENSRSFLTSKKPDKLFQFFYQGTGLEMLEKSYNSIRLMKDDASAELQRKKEMLPEIQKEIKSLKKILATSEKLFEYKCELLWAGVIKIEKRLQDKEEKFQKAEKKLSNTKQEHDNCQKKLLEITTNLDELKKKRNECDAVMLGYRDKLQTFKTEREKLACNLRRLEGTLSSWKREENVTHKEILSLQNSINENLMKDQNDLNEDKRVREKEIQALENELEQKQKFIQDLQVKNSEKMVLQEKLLLKQAHLKSEIASYSYSFENLQRVLIRSQNAIKNKVNVFGVQTENILKEIQAQKHRFSKLPKGPIGAYLEVKEPKWCDAVEACITTRLLKGYCCDNSKDSIILKEILKKFCPQQIPTVIVSQFISRVHDVTNNKTVSAFSTVLDMLNIQDPVIANCLIDLVSIEAKILIEDTNTAVQVMSNNPPNCFAAFLLDCSSVLCKPFRIYSSETRSKKSLLSSVGKREINTIEKDIVTVREDLNLLQSEFNSVLKQINAIPSELNDLNIATVKHKVEEKRISAKIKDLQITEDPKDRYGMEEDLQQLQTEYKKKKIEIQQCELSIKECSEEVSCLQNNIDLNRGLLQNEKKTYDEICSQLDVCGRDREIFASDLNKFLKEIKESEVKLEPLKKEVVECSKYVQTALTHAEEACPRIDTDRSCEVLTRLLDETEKVLEQQSQCNREELQLKLAEKEKRYKEAKKKLDEKEKCVQDIDKMYRKRRTYFDTICANTQICINMAYMTHLGNNYDAEMVFNRKARTLTLKAVPKKSGTQLRSKGGKCSTLSGGERSFVTIAFLLAMWDRIRSPFKILDEYDVFMDSNNRKLSIDLLIEQAKLMTNSQFIFLSPLDLPQIENSSLIKIHQMPSPQRVGNISSL